LLHFQARLKIEPQGLQLLLDLLRTNNVLIYSDEKLELTPAFLAALKYRDLIEAKLYFCGLVAPDYLSLFTELIANPHRFFEQARTFELFSYQNCFQPTPENYALTARWMRITTTLTKYEAQSCLELFDFSRHQRLLDVGGNSGEFALRICKAHPHLRATVYDLPLVCDIGRQHVGAEPEAARIAFVPTQGPAEALPSGHDIISFKSMLHDWPDAEQEQFLSRAWHALPPGGTLLIFERGQLELTDTPPPYSLIPIMLFFRSYRPAQHYVAKLTQSGFHNVRVQHIMLEMPFILITAAKPLPPQQENAG
jgi:ubiquinone/menaquinone biosynthesis C-methylase UbiE